ncbi:hypothetical protein [Streptomyces glaucescens]|nr:hypothetical protein [Streptomyces glaucescens]
MALAVEREEAGTDAVTRRGGRGEVEQSSAKIAGSRDSSPRT